MTVIRRRPTKSRTARFHGSNEDARLLTDVLALPKHGRVKKYRQREPGPKPPLNDRHQTVLQILKRAAAPVRTSELARALTISSSSANAALYALSARGLAHNTGNGWAPTSLEEREKEAA